MAEVSSRDFPDAARRALKDASLQEILAKFEKKFHTPRESAIAEIPEWEELRARASAIKEHVLARLDDYLIEFEENVKAAGGRVHWAADAAEARTIIAEICRETGGRWLAKSKSMVTEEIDLRDFLEKDGLTVTETDMGEFVIQLKKDRPSHLVAPIVHLNKDQVQGALRLRFSDLPAADPVEREALVRRGREGMRDDFLSADIGMTGANFLVAAEGGAVLVSNEGNIELSARMSRHHIVVAGIEKIVPTLDDLAVFLRILGRSAAGLPATVYTSVFKPSTQKDGNGFDVVLVDNGRTRLLKDDLRPTLKCIRCAACLNNCPVYEAVGGLAYGSTYPGPIGAVVMPAFAGVATAHHLPKASTFCGRCADVCPVKIPLPDMMRVWREKAYEEKMGTVFERWMLAFWAAAAGRPPLYRWLVSLWRMILACLRPFARNGWLRWMPTGRNWWRQRDFEISPPTDYRAWAALRREHGSNAP